MNIDELYKHNDILYKLCDKSTLRDEQMFIKNYEDNIVIVYIAKEYDIYLDKILKEIEGE